MDLEINKQEIVSFINRVVCNIYHYNVQEASDL